MRLGAVGIWGGEIPDETAGEIEELGYGTYWISGGFDPGFAPHFEQLLAATRGLTVASGIISVWASDPAEIAQAVSRVEEAYPERFLLGLGVSHSVLVPGYQRPYDKLVAYLDALDATRAVPARHRVIGALGPRMLRLSTERAAGAHPYLVPVEHTAFAREALGPTALLAPEVTVVLEPDADTARAIARPFLARYMIAENYTNNLRRFGFTDDDFADGGSDRLLDALVAWGDAAAIQARVRQHHQAGADHVCIQALTADPTGALPIDVYRELAPALNG